MHSLRPVDEVAGERPIAVRLLYRTCFVTDALQLLSFRVWDLERACNRRGDPSYRAAQPVCVDVGSLAGSCNISVERCDIRRLVVAGSSLV